MTLSRSVKVNRFKVRKTFSRVARDDLPFRAGEGSLRPREAESYKGECSARYTDLPLLTYLARLFPFSIHAKDCKSRRLEAPARVLARLASALVVPKPKVSRNLPCLRSSAI